MNNRTIARAWPLLKKQVRSLNVPWMDNMVQRQGRRDPFRILISCLLSLRTQDSTTGPASERLFKVAPNVRALARTPARVIEKAIYPVGFYRVKARRISELSRELVEHHEGKVPDTMDGLLKLKGVGRKTANLVLTLGFQKPGICVDTHVHRITNRWGLVSTKTPHQTEFALRETLPGKYWMEINGLLVAFGQGVCRPISPLCSSCSISTFCDRRGVTRSR